MRASISSGLCKLVFLILGTSGVLAKEEAKAPPQKAASSIAVDLWIKKYASTSAYLARVKNYPAELQISESNLKTVLSGKPKIIFDRQLNYRGKAFGGTDLDTDDGARRLEVLRPDDYFLYGEEVDKAWALGDRQKRILENVENLVRNRPKDQLLIIDAGSSHGLDLYFGSQLKNPEDKLSKRKDEIFYFLSPISLNTLAETPGARKLQELIRGIESSPTKVKDIETSLYLWFLWRLRFYQNLSRQTFTEQSLKTEAKEKNPGVLVYLDWHGLVATEAFDKMPSASDWKKLGFTSVALATEIFAFGKTYSSEDYEELYLASAKSFPGLSNSEKKIQNWVKESRPLLFPAQQSLHQKLKSYDQNGLPVVYTGLDSIERTETKEKKEKAPDF